MSFILVHPWNDKCACISIDQYIQDLTRLKTVEIEPIPTTLFHPTVPSVHTR